MNQCEMSRISRSACLHSVNVYKTEFPLFLHKKAAAWMGKPSKLLFFIRGLFGAVLAYSEKAIAQCRKLLQA